MSGLRVPARTAAPRAAVARPTSVPGTIRPAAISSVSPSRDRIATSTASPRLSWAAMVSGPFPCDAPDSVVTLMPLERSNSGRSSRYGVENPPEMMTLTAQSLPERVQPGGNLVDRHGRNLEMAGVDRDKPVLRVRRRLFEDVALAARQAIAAAFHHEERR